MGSVIKVFIISLSLLISVNVYASPSNSISIPNSFVAQTTISSADTNANNNEVQSKYNAHTHTDITQVGSITTGVWNGTKIATQYGGTGQDFSSVASGSMLYFNAVGTLGSFITGSSGQVLTLNGTTPTWSSGKQSGDIVQVVNSSTGSMTTGTGTFTISGNAIPQNTGGDQYLSVAITPTSATNKLFIQVVINISESANSYDVAALFQDSTANALAMAFTTPGGTNFPIQLKINYYMTAGTTSATTFKVRAGCDAGSTTTLNGTSGSAFGGGTLISSITVSEIQI